MRYLPSRRRGARPRRRAPLVPALLIALAAAVTVPSPAGAAVAPPATPAFGPGIDGYAADDPVTHCDSARKPGAEGFRALIKNHYGLGNSIDFVYACDMSSPGGHDQARAWDYGADANQPADVANVDSMLNWLLATDAYGNQHALARRFGIEFIIWNRRIIHLSNDTTNHNWRAYSCDGSASGCHTNHVHFEFSWAGARAQTSWWTGGRDRIGVFRAGDWFRCGATAISDWGAPTDQALTGDWDGDGTDNVGLFRPSESRWYFRGLAPAIAPYGGVGDQPIVGRWGG